MLHSRPIATTLLATVLATVLAAALATSAFGQNATPPAAERAPEGLQANDVPMSGPESTTTVRVQYGDAQEIAAIVSRVLQMQALASNASGVIVLVGTPGQIKVAQQRISELEEAAWDRITQQRHEEKQAAAQRQSNQASLSLTIEFPGGTVEEYLKLVHKASGFDNVVVGSDSILALRMPKVQVKRITGSAAIALLETLRFTRGEEVVHLMVRRVEGDPDGVGIDALPVMVVDVMGEDGNAQPPTQVVRTDVFDLGPLARSEPAMLKGLLDAIGVGMSLNGKSESFSTKFHEGTGLLFVKGTSDDLAMVARTVHQIMGQSK